MQRLAWVVLATVMLIAVPSASAQTSDTASCQRLDDTAVASTAASDSGTDPTTSIVAPGDPPSGSTAETVAATSSGVTAGSASVASLSGTPTADAAQDPEPSPGPGEPQPGDPGGEPGPTPGPGEPQPEPGGGGLPQTGLDILRVAIIGMVLLLVGGRIRVVTRRRREHAQAASDPRDAAPRERAPAASAPAAYPAPLYAAKGDWNFPDPDELAPTGLLPSTARRRAKRFSGLDRPATT